MAILSLLAVILAVLAFIIAIINEIKLKELEKSLEETNEGLDLLTDTTIEELETLEDDTEMKVNNLLNIIEGVNNLQGHMVNALKTLTETDEALYEHICNLEEVNENDVTDIITGFFGEEVDECPKAKTCKKAPCKDSCPKKGRPAKK